MNDERKANRNAALDRNGDVWAQGTYTDTWRCLTATVDGGPMPYNELARVFGPIETVHPATEKYRTVR